MAAIYTNLRKRLAGLFGYLDSTSENVQDEVDGLREHTVSFAKVAADAMASTTTASTAFWRAPRDCDVISAEFSTVGTVAADGTDIVGIVLNKADGAGGSATAIGTYNSLTSAQGAIASNVPAVVPISTTAATVRLAAGNVLTFQITKGGAGKVVPAGQMNVRVRWA
jgi:hypothetical protein